MPTPTERHSTNVTRFQAETDLVTGVKSVTLQCSCGNALVITGERLAQPGGIQTEIMKSRWISDMFTSTCPFCNQREVDRLTREGSPPIVLSEAEGKQLLGWSRRKS